MSFLPYIFPLKSKWLENKSVQDRGLSIATKDLFTASITESHEQVIIAGPDTANKTSLVFQAAVSAATNDSKVVHICTHPISKLPSPVHGMPSPQASVMRNVDFLYFEETAELIAYFAGIHMKKKLPSYIIVEDILSYASQKQDKPVERTLAKLLALISDARSWISTHSESNQCSVLLTAPSRLKSMQNILKQFKYELAVYEGASKDHIFSKLSFTSSEAHISITFKNHKDCLILEDVCISASKATVPEVTNTGNEHG